MSKKQNWRRDGADIVVEDAFKDAQPGPEQARATWSRNPNEVVLKFEFHNASEKGSYGTTRYLRAVVTDEGARVYADIKTSFAPKRHDYHVPFGGPGDTHVEFYKDPLGKRRPDADEAEAYLNHWFREKFGEVGA